MIRYLFHDLHTLPLGVSLPSLVYVEVETLPLDILCYYAEVGWVHADTHKQDYVLVADFS